MTETGIDLEDHGQEAEGNPRPVTVREIIFLVISLVLYFFDIYSDIRLAFDLDTGYKISILLIVFVQALFCNTMSWMWYDDPTKKFHQWERVMHLLLLAPVLRYIKAFCYGLKARFTNANNDQGYAKSFRESMEDLALLEVSEGFVEAGPQLVVQMGSWIRSTTSEQLTMPTLNLWKSMTLSILSLAYTMQNYHQTLRLVEDDTKNVSLMGRAVIFLWHLLFESSRIIVLVCLIVMHPIYLLACAFHLVGAFIWLQKYGPEQLDRSKFHHQFTLLWLSYIFLFNAISVRQGSTCKFYTLIYTIFAIEGISVFVTWYFVIHWKNFSFLLPTISIACFILGLAFMAIYYIFCHPVRLQHNLMKLNGCIEHQSDDASYTRVPNDNNEAPCAI